MTVRELRERQIAKDEAVLQNLISIRDDLTGRIMKIEDRLARERGNLRRMDDPTNCIHTPARCNGGGYDGCACGPKPRSN